MFNALPVTNATLLSSAITNLRLSRFAIGQRKPVGVQCPGQLVQMEETMATPPSASRDAVRAVVPKMIDLTEKVLFGDVWERPNLSKRDRSLIVCATLIATYRPEQLRGHLQRALDNGVTKDEISEMITHLAFYSGWPGSMTAANIAKEVFANNP
jgi:4-carboxymuconolactone decarboxylase